MDRSATWAGKGRPGVGFTPGAKARGVIRQPSLSKGGWGRPGLYVAALRMTPAGTARVGKGRLGGGRSNVAYVALVRPPCAQELGLRRGSSRRRSPVAPHIYVSEITPSKPAARRDGVGGGHKPRLGRDAAARRRVPSLAQGLQLPTQTLRHLASWVTRPLRGEKFGPKVQTTGR